LPQKTQKAQKKQFHLFFVFYVSFVAIPSSITGLFTGTKGFDPFFEPQSKA
jgi:hypothetical protein